MKKKNIPLIFNLFLLTHLLVWTLVPFFSNKLYYIAIDTLLIALEFEQNDKFYDLIAEIFEAVDNKELSKKLLDSNLRLKAVNSLKDELSGIFRKNN